MPEANLRGHSVPAEGEHPSRAGWVLNPLLSINDLVPVANATEKAQKLADIGASATRPLVVAQADTKAIEAAWSEAGPWYRLAGGQRTWKVDGADKDVPGNATTDLMSVTVTDAPAGEYRINVFVAAFGAGIIPTSLGILAAGSTVYSPRNDLTTTGQTQSHEATYTHTGGTFTVLVRMTVAAGYPTSNFRGSGSRLVVELA